MVGRLLLPEILGQSDRVGAIEVADFEPIFARSVTVTLTEKSSINTNRKSTTRFVMSLR